MTGATRLVDAAKTTHAELAESCSTWRPASSGSPRLRRDLAYAVTLYGGSTERSDDDHHDPRD